MNDGRHNLLMIAGRDHRPAGAICRDCNRVAWWDTQEFEALQDCAEGDSYTTRQLGERCEGTEVVTRATRAENEDVSE